MSDVLVGFSVVVGLALLGLVEAYTTVAATGLVPAYGMFLAILAFSYRSSLELFSASRTWKLLALISACAFASALALVALTAGASAQAVTLSTSDSASFLLLAGIALAVPTIAFRSAGFLFSRPAVLARLQRRVAIFGANAESLALHEALNATGPGYAFAGLFDDRRGTARVANTVAPLCGTLSTLVRMVRSGQIDEVIVCLPKQAVSRTREVVELLRGYPVDVHVVGHFLEETVLESCSPRTGIERIGNAVLVPIHSKPIQGWGLIAKETMDRAGAAVLLVALAPLFLLIAAAIKLDSSGPVFFRQRRHGLMGRTIVVWKFRTMKCTEDGSVIRQATKRDPRVTKVGSVLRKTSLDELPQLINVLVGEMSLVGPRPHAVAHNEHYETLIADYTHRNQIKPGITGWAQVNGLRGETSTPRQMELRIAHDLDYIRNWTVWFDFKVLLLTPVYGFVSRNAF